MYWTNTNVGGSGTNPSFLAKGSVGNANAQIWTISLDGGYYKIVSKADSHYINEKGAFGTNAYYQNWNTYNIYTDSIYNAIQITQAAATQEKGTWFWNLISDNTYTYKVAYSTNTSIDESKDLAFEFVPTTLTALQPAKLSSIFVWSSANRVNLKCDVSSIVKIYNLMGALLKETPFRGSVSIPMLPGIYIVSLENEIEHKTVKVIVG